mmetsp:Transcript_18485/g.38763  ORF Transcript_18485/g.38763 Transcript_18485/m.38763 type:complete len:343 (-) Transcript_18485:91-1119(-)
MGRVARYKKVKSIDPFAKKSTWDSDFGDTTCGSLRRVKRRSKTALKLKEQKIKKLQKRGKLDVTGGKRKKGGSNGWGDDDGYDLPPDCEDEFDMADLIGSVKKQDVKKTKILESTNKIPTISAPSAAEENWTRKVEAVDLRGVPIENSTNDKSSSSKGTQQKRADCKKSNTNSKKNSDSLTITAKTPTKDIIAAYSNPKAAKAKNKNNQITITSPTSMTKQEKRKAFMEQKKAKKRNRGIDFDSDDDNIGYNKYNSASGTKTAPFVARNAIDDQVERPPIFSSLPRGASKNKKPKITKNSFQENEGEDEKAQRIRKEQLALEAMRENVMKQYAILRESRRGR